MLPPTFIPPPPGDIPPWSFIEWAVSALSAAIIFIGGYVLRTRVKLMSHEETIELFGKDIERLKEEMKDSRELLARQPTRDDLRNDIRIIQTMIEIRFDRLDVRVDNIIKREQNDQQRRSQAFHRSD